MGTEQSVAANLFCEISKGKYETLTKDLLGFGKELSVDKLLHQITKFQGLVKYIPVA